MLVEHNADLRTVTDSQRRSTRRMAWHGLLQLESYSLRRINCVTQSALSVLDLSHCKITDLHSLLTTSVMDRMADHLTSLNVSHNRICELPLTICHLRSITALDASSNLLNEVPPSIALLRQLEHLDVSDNPLHYISDHVIQEGHREIVNYCADILAGATERASDVKVHFIGDEGVGKTSLCHHFSRDANDLKFLPRVAQISMTLAENWTHPDPQSNMTLHRVRRPLCKQPPTSEEPLFPFSPRSASGACARNDDEELRLAHESYRKIEDYIGAHMEVLLHRLQHQEPISVRYRRKSRACLEAFSGNELIEWLYNHTRVTERTLACKIGTIFLQRRYIKPVSGSRSDEFIPSKSYRFGRGKHTPHMTSYHGFDYADQEIYRPLRQLWWNPQSLYIVVVDLRMNASRRLEDWLQSITEITGRDACVVAVGTHLDDKRFADKDDLDGAFEALRGLDHILVPYGAYWEILPVSNTTGEGMERAWGHISSFCRGTPFCLSTPVKYRFLKNALMQERKRLLEYEEIPVLDWYNVLVWGDALAMTESDLEEALIYFHNHGVIAYFPAALPAEQLIHLDPQWLMNWMSKQIRTGVVDPEELKRLANSPAALSAGHFAESAEGVHWMRKKSPWSEI